MGCRRPGGLCGGGGFGPAPSPPSSPQYFADTEEVASWLQEQRSALEMASCGLDLESAQALLLRHLRLERVLRAFGAELQQLDQQARAAAARASLTVRTSPAAPAQSP